MRVIAGSERQPKTPDLNRGENAQTCLVVAALATFVLFDHNFHLAFRNAQFWHSAGARTGLDDTIEQAVGNPPLLLTDLQRNGLIVQANNLSMALLSISIDKTDDVADRNTVASQPVFRLFSDFDIGTIKIDRCI